MKRIIEFLSSDTGKLTQYYKRKNRRINIVIDSLEPQSKKMPQKDQNHFQTSVIDQLDMINRKAFRGNIALSIDLLTTSKNAPQAHTIAKNLLDLLAAWNNPLTGSKRSVLYKDDSQIQALSISCRHGQSHPCIMIEGRPLTAMLEDIELAADAERKLTDANPSEFYRDDLEREWINTLKDLIQNESKWRTQLGNEVYVAYFKLCRWSAQRALLSSSKVNIPVLCWLYNRPKDVLRGFSADDWASLIYGSGVRLQLGELPISAGASQSFRDRISKEIKKFKQKWDWILAPLVVPVALQVIIRPSPSTPKGVLHDLDNIVRDYLLPQIVPSFGTVTDHTWTIDFEELRRVDPKLAERWGQTPLPPKSTKSGVTRYEVWRLPPSTSGGEGFVSVALITDIDPNGSLISQVDERISQWEDTIEKQPRRNKRRKRF